VKEEVSQFFQNTVPGQISMALFQVLPDVLFWVKNREGKEFFREKIKR